MESPAIRQEKYFVHTVRHIKSDDIHLLISFFSGFKGNFVGSRFYLVFVFDIFADRKI